MTILPTTFFKKKSGRGSFLRGFWEPPSFAKVGGPVGRGLPELSHTPETCGVQSEQGHGQENKGASQRNVLHRSWGGGHAPIATPTGSPLLLARLPFQSPQGQA